VGAGILRPRPRWPGRTAHSLSSSSRLFLGFSSGRDIAAFLDAVDGAAFAVPPDVQAPIAVTAAGPAST